MSPFLTESPSLKCCFKISLLSTFLKIYFASSTPAISPLFFAIISALLIFALLIHASEV